MYVPGPASGATNQADIALTDRTGAVAPLKLPGGAYEYPRVSPDGKHVTFGTDDGKEAAVWIYDVAGTSAMRRLTFGGHNRFPIWSADGKRITFQTDREGDRAIFWQPADGTGTAERLTRPDQGASHVPDAWSPTGDRLLFDVVRGSAVSLWTFSRQDRAVAPLDTGRASYTNPTGAVFSPDGRWVAYSLGSGTASGSSTADAAAVYVQPFPPTGATYQVFSKEPAHHPLWSTDGKELLYVGLPGTLWAVSVATQPTFAFGNATPVPRTFPMASPVTPRTFDITPDGKIVGLIAAGQTAAGAAVMLQIQVVEHWLEELKAKVPVK